MEQLTTKLETLVVRRFPATRGREDRIDVYLDLNKLLRLEDTEKSVRLFRAQVPKLLNEFRHDLRHATVQEIVHVCLRTLSYFMHHKSMACVFPDDQVSLFLSDIISLLFSTQDEATYKLCLWCLTIQNFEAKRHHFLQCTVEGLIQAVVNPFKSRAIELQALKGLHLLILKYPEQLLISSSIIRVWWRPIASRLGSSNRSTRDQARRILKEASLYTNEWDAETTEMVQECLMQYALPAMKTHMDQEHNKEALQMWILILILMKATLAKNLTLLTEVMYIPEISMRHPDASVRLVSMEAWNHLIDVFLHSKEWLFKKSVVQLLMRPIIVCLQEEMLLNIVQAAFVLWQKIVAFAVQDFSDFCTQHEHTTEAIQQNSRTWKRWFDEIVVQVLRILLERTQSGAQAGMEQKIAHFEGIIVNLWKFECSSVESGHIRNNDIQSTESRRHEQADLTSLSDAERKRMLFDFEDTGVKTAALSAYPTRHINVELGSSLIGIAILLPDVFSAIHEILNCIQVMPKERYQSLCGLIIKIWSGLCHRIHFCKGDTKNDDQQSKHIQLRLLRLCLEFAFGISTASASSEYNTQNIEADSTVTEKSLSVGDALIFEFPWQVQFLQLLLLQMTSYDELQRIFMHPKSKISLHLSNRIHKRRDSSSVYATVMNIWEDGEESTRIDFAHKTNVLPCVLMYLLFEYSAVIDADSQSGIANRTIFESFEQLVEKVVKCMKESTEVSPNIAQFLEFIEHGVRAAHMLIQDGPGDTTGDGKKEGKLLQVCLRTWERSSGTQENASLLLCLNRLPPSGHSSNDLKPPNTAAVTGNAKIARGGGMFTSSDINMTSPCMLIDAKPEGRQSSPYPSSSPKIPENTEIRSVRSFYAEADTCVADDMTARVPITRSRSKRLAKMHGAYSVDTPSRSSIPSTSASRKQTRSLPVTASKVECVFSDLIDCEEEISLLYRHLPLAFRQFLSLCKINTIGDLSAMSIDQLNTIDLKDPLSTVTKALEEFRERKKHMTTHSASHFHHTMQPPLKSSTSPLSSATSPSPRKVLKRRQNRLFTSLPLESPQQKRTRHSFRELSSEFEAIGNENEDEQSETMQANPKIADRVKFCVPVGKGDTTCIVRPGEDLQNPHAVLEREEMESPDEKLRTFSAKFLQHLSHAAHYMDKIAAIEESSQSEASPQTKTTKLNEILDDLHHASSIVAKVNHQLQIIAEASAKRRQTIIEKEKPSTPKASGMNTMDPPSQLIKIDSLDLEVDRSSLDPPVSTGFAKILKAKYCGAHVSIFALRTVPIKDQLWSATIDTLQKYVLPFPHPNLMHILGVVDETSAGGTTSRQVIMEYLPVSLYDVLHRDHVKLSRHEIACISVQILQALQFLHHKNCSLRVPLTSRKVMFSGANKIKLRQFSQELIRRNTSVKLPGVALTCSYWQTQYELPEKQPDLSNIHLASQKEDHESISVSIYQDLYGFGILLMEMCTGDKPNPEFVNRVSCAGHMDPAFEKIIRLALGQNGEKNTTGTPFTGFMSAEQVSADQLLQILITNELQYELDETRLSSASFPCFIYADRYFLDQEARHIEARLQERPLQSELAAKRLAAVERELVDEQKNFEILVKQLEQVQQEKRIAIEENQRLLMKIEDHTHNNDVKARELEQLRQATEFQRLELESLHALIRDQNSKLTKLQADKTSDMNEKHSLLLEILKLKDDKRRTLDQKQEVEAERDVLATKVGREKESIEDLEERWKQVIHLWEQEQHHRRMVEKQLEALNRQLVGMEEERSLYSYALHQCPTGERDSKRAASYVLELKEKEIEKLSERLAEAEELQSGLRIQVALHQRELCDAKEENQGLVAEQMQIESARQVLSLAVDEKQKTIEELTTRLQQAASEMQTLKTTVKNFEDEQERQAMKAIDEANARRLRQCLTPNCDAPRYLVGPSGFCKECEEKSNRRLSMSKQKKFNKPGHRRQRSLDEIISSSICNNAKNAQIKTFLHAIDRTLNDEGLEDDQKIDLVLLGYIKQLTTWLKENESLKDDLPECNVLKSILSLMHQFQQNLPFVLECCKCLSVIVFNHDRNRIILVAEGVVELILCTMKHFGQEVKLLESGCVLLTNLAHNSESNRKRILDVGGVDIVLHLMQAFPLHTGMQKRCCWALLTFAGSDSMCENIVTRGGFGAIIAGMLNCAADEHVQYYGSWALLNLVSGTSPLRDFARQEGVVEVAEAAIAYFPDHRGIQEKARSVVQLVGLPPATKTIY